MTFDTLLTPTDGSDPAEATVRRGFDLAAQLEASVHVLSVADSSLATGAGYSGDSTSIRARLRERADTRAASLRADAEERGLDATAVVREGIPAKEIVDYADEQGLDAITLGTSGRGASRVPSPEAWRIRWSELRRFPYSRSIGRRSTTARTRSTRSCSRPTAVNRPRQPLPTGRPRRAAGCDRPLFLGGRRRGYQWTGLAAGG